MADYLLLKTVHILSSTLLFGTGLGTAFHGWMANRSGDAGARRVVNRNVVLADWLFTTPAVIVQPVTGVWLAHIAGFPLTTGWLAASIALYLMVGACWLPVVGIQIRMRRIADATPADRPLPARYFQLSRTWFLLGWPAFIGVIVIFWLMVTKPEIAW
ncbi:DUF2269 domain-containing protein [Sphingomonas sp. SORGH_AS_0879]|uniref:DUF2269 family protein n=1 Tax=Sphingomonas sp. SORGH_AS_0879 TaxID=3041790 RepID=UPI002785E642|nr:DUF2269 domain-containing protein [Sphingomonas sp. SORGH_AS_0879]MDQ1231286.1 putative membrane protein [Sphingomonas sp. SORGH_AS_0879]